MEDQREQMMKMMAAKQQQEMQQQQQQPHPLAQLVNGVANDSANRTAEMMSKQQAIQNQQFQQLMQQLEVKNQMLEQQNGLMQTKIQKDELINSARTTASANQRPISSPKKRGGPVAKPKFKVLGSNGSQATVGGGGGQMKMGGPCGLPGGRNDMRNKRR